MQLDPNIAQATIQALEGSARAYERREGVDQLQLAPDSELAGQLTLDEAGEEEG